MLVTFQRPSSHMWLVATVLNPAGLESSVGSCWSKDNSRQVKTPNNFRLCLEYYLESVLSHPFSSQQDFAWLRQNYLTVSEYSPNDRRRRKRTGKDAYSVKILSDLPVSDKQVNLNVENKLLTLKRALVDSQNFRFETGPGLHLIKLS